MKRDAREFAHLVKAFKGGAEYLWCNFDQVHLTAIYAECAAIEDAIQAEIKTGENTIGSNNSTPSTGAKMKVTEGGGFAFNYLEDVPCTPEDESRYRKMFAERRRIRAQKKKQKQLK